MVSVGDLVDRGPRSWDCLQLHGESWFHGVRGNHESHLLGLAYIADQLFRQEEDYSTVIDLIRGWSGGMDSGWFTDWLTVKSNRRKLLQLTKLLKSIPDILTVRGEGFAYNVVHAELDIAGITKNSDITHVDYDPLETTSNDASATKWSRSLFNDWLNTDPKDWDRQFDPKCPLSPTFCGHNVTPKPFTWKNHFFIDTGCGFFLPEYPGVLGLTAIILPEIKTVFMPAVLKAKKSSQRKQRVLTPTLEAVA